MWRSLFMVSLLFGWSVLYLCGIAQQFNCHSIIINPAVPLILLLQLILVSFCQVSWQTLLVLFFCFLFCIKFINLGNFKIFLILSFPCSIIYNSSLFRSSLKYLNPQSHCISFVIFFMKYTIIVCYSE